jgi:hypothetical protein
MLCKLLEVTRSVPPMAEPEIVLTTLVLGAARMTI